MLDQEVLPDVYLYKDLETEKEDQPAAEEAVTKENSMVNGQCQLLCILLFT